MDPERDDVAHRLCGNYLFFVRPNHGFSACDAISLAQLELQTKPGARKDYYAAAATAVVAGLRLPSSHAVWTLFQRPNLPEPPALPLTAIEMFEVFQLSRLRQAALALYRQHDGYLLGG